MPGMVRWILNTPRMLTLSLVLAQSALPEETCLPCGGEDHPAVATVRQNLEKAFSLSMTIADCDGADHLQVCRSIEGLVEDAFAALDGVVAEGEAGGSIDCVTCDPRPYLSPLFSSFEAVAAALVDRGYIEFSGKQARMQQDIQLWRGYSCCAAAGERPSPSRNREMDARAVLGEKCGENFEKNRAGLRQVVRMPDERNGCFQSRACRDATQHEGQFMEAGFWTYDGEYWYIWEKRRTPRGDWIECND
jgi:hypothetical protein